HIKLRLPGKPLNYLLIWVKPFTLAHTDKTVFGSRPPALICCLAEACPCIQHEDVGGASHGCRCVTACVCGECVCASVDMCVYVDTYVCGDVSARVAESVRVCVCVCVSVCVCV